jgi:hypothetical protein
MPRNFIQSFNVTVAKIICVPTTFLTIYLLPDKSRV